MQHLHHPLSVLVAIASMMIAPALVALRPQPEVEYDNIDFDFQED